MNEYKEYPFDLLSELGIEKVELQKDSKPSFDVQAGIAYALSTLNLKEKMVIRLYFEDYQKARDIAEILGLSLAGAYELKKAALEKLRNPIICSVVQYGIVGYAKRRYKEGYQKGYQKRINETCNDPDALIEIKKESIKNLNLSTRAYHCLTRCWNEPAEDVTIGTICELDAETIGGIRYFGAKCADEVARALRSYGITGTEWDNFLTD